MGTFGNIPTGAHCKRYFVPFLNLEVEVASMSVLHLVEYNGLVEHFIRGCSFPLHEELLVQSGCYADFGFV